MQTRLVYAAVVVVGLLGSNAFAQLEQRERVEAVMVASGRANSMPLIEERLHVTIDGQHASTTLHQVYENNTGGQTEGRYRLRAGFNSHVEGFSYWNGEKKIVGEVFEKQMARQVYENVTARRRDPGLLEQDGEGAFSFRVFPIEAKEKKRVELHWTKWLERRAKTVRYRAPVMRADAEIVITVTGAVKNVKSSTHRLHVETITGGVRLRSEGARTTGELELEWQVDDADWQPHVVVQPASAGDGWFALSLAAPDVGAKQVAAKDVTIVIDRSGSMHGDAIVHARRAAVDMVALLNAGDRLNVISFSDEVDPLFAKPQVADQDTRRRATSFIERLREGGGTDIALALKTAVASQDREGGRPRVIVFITDGQSDAQRALDAANADTGDVRMFTIGLGNQVNRPLLQRLAAVKRGRFVFIDNAAAIEREVGRLASSIAKPLLVDVELEIEGAHAVRLYPRSLPDVFAQDELLVTGRIRGKGTAKFIVKGRLAGKAVTFTRSVDLAKAKSRPWVGRLWAQSRVAHLLEEISLGTKDSEMQNEVIELALAYNFVTPYTSFLAIPQSELGDMRGTVEAARKRKSKIMADNPDVAELDKAKQHSFSGGGSSGRNGLGTSAGAPPDRTASVDMSSEGGGDDDDEEDESPRSPSPGGGQYSGVRSDRKHGCAGCATNGSSAGGLVLLVAIALIVRRRRR